MFFLFLALAIIAFIAFAIHSQRRNGHGMVYAAVCCLVWLFVASWWDGRL